MKKNLLKSIFALLIIPIIFLSGCGTKSTKAINLSTYLKDEASAQSYMIDEPSKIYLSSLTSKKVDKEKLNKFVKIDLTADAVWFYKMYIDYITFYIYTTESSDSDMIINLTMNNLIDEPVLGVDTDEDLDIDTFSQQISIKPKKKTSVKCTYKINKTVAVAAANTNISIDIINSANDLFSKDSDTYSFMWLIYGLEIHGESRAYNK